MANSIVIKNMESNAAQLPLADRLWDWFDTYRKQVALAAGILFVAGVIVWFVLWHQEQKQVDAGTALSQVAAAQLDGSGTRAEASDAYLKVARNYPNSIIGARALLLAAGSSFTEGKYQEAQTLFERFTREYQGSPFMGEALLGIASCLDAEGKTEQAVSSYKDLMTRHPNESFVPQVKFALARIYETQNKPEQARDLYQDIERSAPFSSLGNEAGVRLEELIAKNPALAPAPPPPAASSTTNLVPLLEKK
jgi:TolA-binding protein